jgi:GntR family transcriptional regulator, transcriptional repressor for pyruvate dehydrogenase complex
VSRETLADDLAEQLLQDVIDGRYRPGAPLPPEADIAEDAGVSRLTLREAVKTLRAKNVVRIERGRGTFVNPPNRWTDLSALVRAATASRPTGNGAVPRRLIEARRVIEVGAAELAAARRSDADLDALEATLGDMRAAAAGGDAEAFVAADIAFHAAVLDAAGNVFLAAVLDPLGQLLVEARRQTSAYEEIRVHAIAHHEAIIAAIRSGLPERASEAMRAHMDQTKRDLETYVLTSGASGEDPPGGSAP